MEGPTLMTIEEVAAARDVVVASGREPTTRAIHEQLGFGSMRDILRRIHRLRTLEAAPNVARPHPPAPQAPPTLLAAAEAGLRAAITAANAARRARDFAPMAERAVCDEQLRRRERERRRAQDQVDALRR